jgi:hypothetical protein
MIAGQILTLQRTTDDRLAELGMLQLSRKGARVFLVYFEVLAPKSQKPKEHVIVAGWKNPPIELVLEIRRLIEHEDDLLYVTIARTSPPPIFMDFDIEE